MLQLSALPVGPSVQAAAAPAEMPTLCQRLQRLEPEAWRSLYCEHRRLVRGVLAGYLGHRAELEDATQQVFETALLLVSQNRVKLTGDASGPRAWLAAISIRVARTESRRMGKVRLIAPAYEADLAGPPGPDPEERQLLEHAMSIVARLPERYRAPWLLRHLEHFTLEETAVATGVSLATIKRRLQAADREFQNLALRDHVLREHLNRGGNHD